MEKFSSNGVDTISLIFRKNDNEDCFINILNFSIHDCDNFVTTYVYKSMVIELYISDNFNNEVYSDYIDVLEYVECPSYEEGNSFINPDGEMLYEYQILSDTLIKVSKW